MSKKSEVKLPYKEVMAFLNIPHTMAMRDYVYGDKVESKSNFNLFFA